MAIGTRLAHGARVVRGAKREVISRCYNLLLRTTLAAGFSDAQCGFKAIRADRARALLPLVQDTGWFFDTELLFLAERAGMRIHEVPVDWVDDPDSRVDLVSTALDDLKGVARLVRAVATGSLPLAALLESTSAEQAVAARPGLFAQLARFSVVGVVSTVAYVVLYVVLRGAMPALAANALALLVTAVANTAANRRLTFGVRSPPATPAPSAAGHRRVRRGLGPHERRAGRCCTTSPRGRVAASRSPCSLSAGAAATAVRFALFRSWVFPGSADPASASTPTVPAPTVVPSPTAPGTTRAVAQLREPPMTTDLLPVDPIVTEPPGAPGWLDRRTRNDEHRPRAGAAPGGGAGPTTRPGSGRRCSTLLVGTAVLYLWGLGASGWANSFYSAAVQAGTKSWKAFFFGSSDASNFITVDKPPASLWVMEISARIFGAQLVEHPRAPGARGRGVGGRALRGGAALVPPRRRAPGRRWCSPPRRWRRSCSATTTPTRSLVLLLTVAAYATVRALERASTWWLVLAMSAVGTGFITKMLQAFLVVPAIGLVYLRRPHAPAPAPWPARRRRRWRWWCRRAGGWRPCSSPRPPTGPTSAGRRTTASST